MRRAAARVLKIAGGKFGFPSPWGFTRGPGFLPMAFSFAQLTWQDEKTLNFWLAKEVKVAPDNVTFTVTLRDNLKFSDGSPLTADDTLPLPSVVCRLPPFPKEYDTMNEILTQVRQFHGHLCPGLTMGVRAAQIALREIGPHSMDEEVVAIVETDM